MARRARVQAHRPALWGLSVESALGIAIGLVATLSAGAVAWLRSAIERAENAHHMLQQRVSDLEVGGLRGVSQLELKISEQLGAIRETLALILARIGHLETADHDPRIRQHPNGRQGN